MNYTIEKKDAFKVIGTEKQIPYDSAYHVIPRYWDQFMDHDFKKYSEKQLKEWCLGKYGISMSDEKNGVDFKYLIAGDYHGEPVPEELKIVEIPAMTWAKFQCVGPLPGALQSVNTRIFHEWLPGNQQYEIAAGINIEMYTMNDSSSDDYISEIWIPVKEKK